MSGESGSGETSIADLSPGELARISQQDAMDVSLRFVVELLETPSIRAYISQLYVQGQIEAGHLVPREKLIMGRGMVLVPEGSTILPEATLERLEAEYDQLRELVARHLAGEDLTEELTDLLDHGLSLDSDGLAIVPRDDVDVDEPFEDDESWRPAGMPRIGEQQPCSNRRAHGDDPPMVPDDDDHPHQAVLSFIRWREVLCASCHTANGGKIRAS